VLIGGPVALLSFLAFLLVPTLRVLRRARPDDGLVALAIGVLITMVSAVVAIVFAGPTGAALLALLTAALAVYSAPPPVSGATGGAPA
jgi:O-antigen ligase